MAEASANFQYSTPLGISTTPIPGVLVLNLTVHADNRGWFKENWQRAKMLQLGMPDFKPVQNNISFNKEIGVTRGIHAEPWDKFISVATGRAFGAWVDLREGPTFGTVFTRIIDPNIAVYVPHSVGNAYQTLEPETAYTYLVNAHWSPRAKYTFLNLADETVGIQWPIPLSDAILSEKDKGHPRLADVKPLVPKRKRVLVTGSGGQLGRALLDQLPQADFDVVGVDLKELNIADPTQVAAFDWSSIDIIINAAAWTNVDGAESPEGRPAAWAANATGPANLARAAAEHDLTLVHVSSEYTFDGTKAPHTESEPPSPLGVYGQSKAGGDAAVAACPKHFLVRTSWVVGDGHNFVRTMAGLAANSGTPHVVDDQIGRLTFTPDLAAGIIHLLTTHQRWGTYNLSNEGDPMSWAEVARNVYELTGHDPQAVTPVRTAEYFAHKDAAPRPLDSTLDLSKIEATGYHPVEAKTRLQEYLKAMKGHA
ncbi:NAD-dependent epimerase/dehydratase family protein [Propionibacterium freudenreichii]|uniref:sugar nucleotide-binding protein n=1 Tax=Propionibacterium freudenreichii TaxID=1744 RepID=UPI001107F469|nr:bifunctional dTDP-4-dehydrorhamnose 3,5-epimerase family protein/NAD(P)-dependent oxidoreductase [Propionibacterium freudenreichii]MCT2995064.1 NAD-dependent epimerase/dehydratase family protein [Propionibacterium freudenreichii]MDK9674265.1 sugar nucleotide-binding protein [Propionibacterium freudenreichii]